MRETKGFDKVASLLQSIDQTQQTLTEAQSLVSNQITLSKSLNFDTLTKQESSQIFKDMLEEHGVGSQWKWEDANRII